MFYQVFLDMDGIFVDFDEGVRQRYGVDWYPTQWKIPYKEWGFDFKSFWEDVDDVDFWARLPWTEDGKRIVALVEPFKPTILSASFLDGATAGKMAWLTKNYPDTMKDGQRRVLIANGKEAKQAIAGPGKILIDDNEDTVDEWTDAGGIGILYPRPWNRHRGSRYPLEFLCSSIMLAMGGGE
jgi:hypothetical protein